MKKLALLTYYIFISNVLLAQFQGTNPVELSASGAYAYLKIGLSTEYSWIQSYGPRPLRINDLGNDVLFNTGGGSVGIGTLSPDAKLTVVGSVGSLFSMSATGANAYLKMGLSTDYAWIQSYGSKPLRINEIGNDVIFNVNGGNVAIGTIDPKGYRLAVGGKAIAEEVVVKLQANWPDYVFEKNYNLPTLAEVETYINQNKHLPEVPAANEIEKNGIKLGEMNMLLLKKVEELTLYVLEQNKMNQIQSDEIKLLKQQLRTPKLGEMDVLLLKKVEELTLYLLEQNKKIEMLEKRLNEKESKNQQK